MSRITRTHFTSLGPHQLLTTYNILALKLSYKLTYIYKRNWLEVNEHQHDGVKLPIKSSEIFWNLVFVFKKSGDKSFFTFTLLPHHFYNTFLYLDYIIFNSFKLIILFQTDWSQFMLFSSTTNLCFVAKLHNQLEFSPVIFGYNFDFLEFSLSHCTYLK